MNKSKSSRAKKDTYISMHRKAIDSLENTGPSSKNKNSPGDEIANVNFYAVRPDGTRIR